MPSARDSFHAIAAEMLVAPVNDVVDLRCVITDVLGEVRLRDLHGAQELLEEDLPGCVGVLFFGIMVALLVVVDEPHVVRPRSTT